MHLTVRMAWHDNDWNGKVCCDPAGNTYCTGAHSLLSGRIEKNKDTDYESKAGVKGEYVSENFHPSKVPPCYWSINAFGDQEFAVEHHHPFRWLEKSIPDVIKKNSVVTWNFKLSFVHSESNAKKHGNYWADLNQRIDNYVRKFTPNESIIFFYANYDNPVSADDMRHLLVGCSVVAELPTIQHFDFADDELAEIRAPKLKKDRFGKETLDVKMSNFPTMNWMLQFTHAPDKAVRIPYREYIRYTEANPDAEDLLQEVKVIIEEPSLIPSFKYVSMDIDDDKCLYLLYKLRKSIKKIQEHNQLVVKRDLLEEERRINELIARTWAKRGIYPSLHLVLDRILKDEEISLSLANMIRGKLTPKYDLAQFFKDVIEENLGEELDEFEDSLVELSENRTFRKYSRPFATLSMFTLTTHQIEKIVSNKILLKELEDNPYALYEEYEADDDDLDIPDMQDEPIDVFKIDLGMIPDKKYVKRHRGLQALREDSPERVRSVIINYLWAIGANGHCYDSAAEVLKELYNNPLIYKNDIDLDDEALLNLDQDYRSHFVQKLHIAETDEAKYFYLDVAKKSEYFIRNLVEALFKRPDHTLKNIDIESHIEKSLDSLKSIIKTEEQKTQFAEERERLYKNIFEKSFFLLTGKPGAGKTYETSKIIEHLYHSGEEIQILAPTGKATLRLTENIKKYTNLENIEAKTIDKFIHEKKFGWVYDNWLGALNIPERDKILVDNLVIDESSMLDLTKLATLFSIIKISDKYPKRIILVGDENQLPPIGFGKPFHDIIEYIQESDELAANHYINLVSNCRQENDEKILKLAEVFTDKTRCYEEAFDIIESGEGKKSNGLFVYKWKNKAELHQKVQSALDQVFDFELEDNDESEEFTKLNRLFGLYDTGNVNNKDFKFRETLQIENFQVLSPYRTGYFGTLGVNKLFQTDYRVKSEFENENKYFRQGDKVIRLSNWYAGRGDQRYLKLSNGSMGIVNSKHKSFRNDAGQMIDYNERKYYFRDSEYPLKWVDDEENFDLAYAITVHKSQGSDFKNVFVIIPEKQSLLSKELLYTALTRSTHRLFIFVQDVEVNLLLKAKNNSHLIHRNTSIFKNPVNRKGKYSPEYGVVVASKIEFIIYNALQKSGLKFKYEDPLQLASLPYKIHPDFTIFLRDGKKLFWEHLGMLDTRKYYSDWLDRRRDYDEHGFKDSLITTDDLNGVSHEKITQLIEDIKEMSLRLTPNNRFSDHHYEL